MKYMLLVYAAEDIWKDGEREACMEESIQLCHALHQQKKYISASPLHSVTTATSVKVRDGKKIVTDGPFAETTEQLGGYYLVEANDLDEAIEIAGRIPGARVGTVEIRPIHVLTNLPNV